MLIVRPSYGHTIVPSGISFPKNTPFPALFPAIASVRNVERPIPTYYGDEICHVNGIPYAFNVLMTTYRFYKNRKRKTLSYPGVMDIPRIIVG